MSLYSGFDILLKINNDDKNVIPQKNRQAVNAAFDNFQTAAAVSYTHLPKRTKMIWFLYHPKNGEIE